MKAVYNKHALSGTMKIETSGWIPYSPQMGLFIYQWGRNRFRPYSERLEFKLSPKDVVTLR